MLVVKKMRGTFRVLVFLFVFLCVFNFVSAACVNLSDASTYGTAVADSSGVLQVSQSVSLCRDNYNFTKIALNVSASGVVLDCNSSTLIGNKSNAGITDFYKDNTVIKNCIMSNFTDGIYLYSGLNNSVINNTVYGCNKDILLWINSNSNATKNNVSSSENSGIDLYLGNNNSVINNLASSNLNYGISLSQEQNSTLINNTINSNVGYGIYLLNSDYNTLINNTANYNQFGLHLQGARYNNVNQNTFANNSNVGIDLVGNGEVYSISNIVISNTITANLTNGGVYCIRALADCDNNTFFQNSINGAGEGIFLYQSDYNNVTRNTIILSYYYDIQLYTSNNNLFDSNVATNSTSGIGYGMDFSSRYNVFVNNSALYNNEGFFIIDSASSNNNFTNNTANQNDYGFYVRGISGIYDNNTACSNEYDDFYLDSSSSDNTGNNTCSSLRKYGSNSGLTCNTHCNFIQGKCSQAFVEDTILTQNINCSSEGYTALTAYSDNITLDCDGYSIFGPGSTGTGVDIEYYNNITIKNCNLSDFGYGIYSYQMNNSLIKDNLISNNQQGVYIGEGINNNVSNNNVTLNADYDIYLSSSSTNFGDNVCSKLNDESGTDNNITCSIRPDFVQGVCSQAIFEYTLLTENISNCPADGLQVYSNNSVLDCNGYTISAVDDSEDEGIQVYLHDNFTMKNCIIDNFYYGVDFENSYNGTAINNTFSNNYVGGYFDEASGVLFSNNTFLDNYYGLYLEQESDNNEITYNNFTGSTYGFFLNYADNNRIGNNFVNSNSYNFGESGSSCPLLYTWNGTSYTFISDMSTEGKLSSKKPYPDDYLKIEGSQLQPQGGRYNLQVTEEYDEISFVDQLKLITLDHSPDVNVFNGLTRAEAHNIFTVSKSPSPVVSCTDALGNDCLSAISAKDGTFTMSPVDNITNQVTLNLGNLTNASEIKLIVSYSWVNGYLVNNSLKSVQVKDENNNWVSIFSDSDLTVRAALQKTYVLNLTNRFLTDDYSVRLVLPIQSIDYVALDTTPQQDVLVNEYDPLSADLHYRGYSNFTTNVTTMFYYNDLINQSFSIPSGKFTKYGDVLSLVNSTNDIYAIIGHGDEISLSYDYESIPDGKERDFLMFEYAYYKPASLDIGKKVEPLPFREMSKYPYSSNESYPSDAEHLSYISEYNNRSIISERYGGSLPYSVNNSVYNNTILVNGAGFGLYLYEETDSSILNNTISGDGYGIELESSTGTIIQGNNISVNYYPVYLQGSDSNEIKNNTLNTSSPYSVIFINDASSENVILHNRIRGDIWVVDYTGENSYNDSYSGNIYYRADGSSSGYFYSDWAFYSIDDTGDGWADSGFVPFDSMHSQNGEWPQSGADYHPAIEDNPSIRTIDVNLVSPSNNSNSSSPISFTFNVSLGLDQQSISYCNLSAVEKGSLLGLWHFDNDLIDYSRNNADGTANGGEFNSSKYKFGNASYYLDGMNAIGLPDGSVFTTINDFSAAAWVNLDESDGFNSILAFGNGGDEFLFNIYSGMVSMYATGVGTVYSNFTVPLNEWHHVAVVRNSTLILFYLDGVLADTDDGFGSEAITPAVASRAIGSNSYDNIGETFTGYLDDVAIWNRVLSAQEILDINNSAIGDMSVYADSSSSVQEDQNNVFSLDLSSGNYSWSVSCTEDAGLIGSSETRILTVKEESQNTQEEVSSSSSTSGHSPEVYYTNAQFGSNGNSYSMHYLDKINFVIDYVNHTLTMNQFNSTTATVLIQSSPIKAILEKGKLYEFDVDGDSFNEVRARYGGINGTKALIFIQEIKKDNNNDKTRDSSSSDGTAAGIRTNDNSPIFISIVLIIVVVFSAFLIYKHYRKRRYYHKGY